MRSRFQLRSLAVQITILVLAMLAIFTVALGLTVFQLTDDWLQESAVAGLDALAAARQSAIQIQLNDYLDSLNSFAQPSLEGKVEALLAAGEPERTTLHDDLVADMHRQESIYPYLEWAEIVDLTGTVVAATVPGQEDLQLTSSQVFAEGQQRPFISDPFAESGRIHLELSLPLRGAQRDTIAVLILHFDAEQLLAITGDYTGLGATGETVLGARRGNDVHFLAPLRFDPNLSNIAPVPASGELAKPMIHATAGQSGVTRAPDYRGVQVVAAYRPIELTGWGVVVKQDEAETLAGVARLRSTLLAGMGILLLLGTVVTAPLMRAFLQPLHELERATRRVAGGDLTTNLPISQLDEVGQLAESFNTMVARLREAHEELAHSNQELASFAYVVSHDLKAPLRGIVSLSEWLEEDLEGKLETDQQEQMRLLRERVQRMHALIDGLLEYSRVGHIRGPVVLVDVGALLVRAIDSVNPPDHIHVAVTPPMPTLQTDELRLSQVFQNLIDNAVKCHPGPQGRVEVACRDMEEFWEFSVSDDGLGIEPRHHERIFQMFQSLQPRTDVESTGIGLALVKKIVEERGGRVWVESNGEAGHGATFRFTWPKKE